MSLPPTIYISAAAAGVASHITYFNKGEHHLYGTLYLKCFLASIIAGTASAHYLFSQPWLPAFTLALGLVATYLTGLYTSLLTYRIFFHPLRHFPGPFGAKLSTVYLSTRLNHNLCNKLHEYHNRYGLFVRTGSSDLSITHPKAVEAIYSASSRCSKAAYYDFTHPGIALQNMRDPHEHAARRKVWAAAFSDRLLRGYEQRLRKYRHLLVRRLAGMQGQPVDVCKWVNLYSFDVMGELTFGEGFESLERGEDHWAIKMLNTTMRQIGLFVPIWLLLTLLRVPGLSADWFGFLEFCGQKLLFRLKVPFPPPWTSFYIAEEVLCCFVLVENDADGLE